MSDAHKGRREVMPSGLVIENPSTMHDPAPLAYSQIAIVPAGARMVFVAGQVGGPKKGAFADQVDEAFSAIATAMRAAGGDIADVAKLTVYIVDHDRAKHDALKAAVKAVFGDRLAPTCTIVPLTQCGTDPEQLVEIEAVGILAPLAD
jgi:enamine deaminase RidA (YjgF/YER057c/UK114 family)